MASTETQTCHASPSAGKHEPREELLRIPQTSPTKTGLRRRGQTSVLEHMKSESESSIDQGDTSLRPDYARSIVSTRSEATLGILEYYFDDATAEHADRQLPIDSALRNFDFDLAPGKDVLVDELSQEDDRVILPSYRINFFRKTIPKLTTPPRRRLGIPYLQQSRRRSSLSICCQGEGVLENSAPVWDSRRKTSDSTLPELSFSCHTADSSPISPRNVLSPHHEGSLDLTQDRQDSITSVKSVRPMSSHPSDATTHRARPQHRNDSLQSSIAPSALSYQHHSKTATSDSGSSFDFVRSVRRRPVPLQETPTALRLHGGTFSQLRRRLTSRIRHLFRSSLRRRR